MGQFNTIFNKASIYEMFFFNVKAVLIYPTLNDLTTNVELYNNWIKLSKFKYGLNDNSSQDDLNATYLEYAPNHTDYVKIIAITYATLYLEDGKIKRFFKKIINNDESSNIEHFFDVLNQISSDGVASQPQYFPTLCGYNIINYDIPLLLKRFLVYRDNINENNKKIPYILKRCLDTKPWNSDIIDVMNLFKFNGYDGMPLSLIINMLNLKKKDDLLSNADLSKYYWENINVDVDKTLEFVSLQSAIQTNACIQIVNELRQL